MVIPGRALRWVKRHPPYVYLAAYLLIVVFPLLWMGIVIAIRSGILVPTKAALVGDQIKVYLAFIAGGLATSVTFIAAIFSWDHNRMEHGRLILDSTTKDLEIIAEEKARVAGALASMVKLGQPVVAMRALGPIWTANAVDSYTATWLIDQVLNENRELSAVKEAATLLQVHSKSLTDEESHAVSWPGQLHRHWNYYLPEYAKQQILKALIHVITSQSISWWQFNDTGTRWFIRILLEAAEDRDKDIRVAASKVLISLNKNAPGATSSIKEKVIKKLTKISVSSIDSEWHNRLCGEIEKWSCGGDSATKENASKCQFPAIVRWVTDKVIHK